ncbi:MAG TPA: sugar ABC transporter permease [Chloroflexota bacterium]
MGVWVQTTNSARIALAQSPLGTLYQPRTLRQQQARFGYFLVLPCFLVLCATVFYPIAQTFIYSLYTNRLNQPFLGTPFVGLANYATLLGQPAFWKAVSHTVEFTSISVAGEVFLGMLVALTINQSFRGRGAVRAAVLIPWALPGIVIGLSWAWLYLVPFGVLNDVLTRIGVLSAPFSFLGDANVAMYSVSIASIWRQTPFAALILLAGLQTIPSELYEAAKIDGASRLQRLGYITLPLLRGPILVVLIFRTLGSIRTFDLIFAMTRGGPIDRTETLSLYTYRLLFGFLDIGLGSAAAVTMVILASIICFIYIKGLKVRLY